jgi:hypothetical protein
MALKIGLNIAPKGSTNTNKNTDKNTDDRNEGKKKKGHAVPVIS